MASAENGAVLDRFVDKAGRLYTLPAVAVEVLHLTDRPDVDVEQLRRAIENDPALTSRVLRIVNSSLFGLSREVSDLKQALALLGTKPLKLLVLGFSLPDNLFIGTAGDILRRYWRRTLTKAVAAREISETLWKLPGDEAFLAGLLQDVGMLVLLQEYGEPYVRLLDAAFAKARDVGALAVQAIGFDHAHLTARLLEKWGLPRNLVEAIGAGRPPETIAELSPQARCLPQILHLAELLAGLLTENRTDLLPDLLDAAERYHALRRSELSGLVGTLQAKVEQLADVLNLELGNGKDYTAVMLEAHARLSDVAADVAGDLIRPQQPDEVKDSESLLAEVQALQAAAKQAARSSSGASSQSGGKDTTLRAKLWAQGHTPHSPSASHQSIGPKTEPVTPRAPASLPAGEIDPAFLGELTTAAASCRQARCPLSLLLVAIDRFEDVAMARGVQGVERVIEFLGAACRTSGVPGAVCRRAGDSQFALLLPANDRQAAVAAGTDLLDKMRHFGAPLPGQVKPSVTVSIGIASARMPPKNFQPGDLIESAERCLHASRLSGGNALKSIEIY